jgi:hypothetical protein
MLAEKFFLVLEALRSHASDGSVKVVSTAPHVPVELPDNQEAASVGEPLATVVARAGHSSPHANALSKRASSCRPSGVPTD